MGVFSGYFNTRSVPEPKCFYGMYHISFLVKILKNLKSHGKIESSTRRTHSSPGKHTLHPENTLLAMAPRGAMSGARAWHGMYGCIDAWMWGLWVCAWAAAAAYCVHYWVHECMPGCVGEWMNACMNGMTEWMNEWMNGWMVEWLFSWFNPSRMCLSSSLM